MIITSSSFSNYSIYPPLLTIKGFLLDKYFNFFLICTTRHPIQLYLIIKPFNVFFNPIPNI